MRTHISSSWLSRFRMGLIFTLIAGAVSLASAASDHYAVLISVDGLASYYLNDPKAHMPTIHKLIREGAMAERMEVSFPSVTWPNHTTLVTGVEPGKHGVIGNSYLDRASGSNVTLITDPIFDKEQIVKVPTVYDVAHAAGLKTAGVIWPASRNAKNLDWQVPDVGEQDLFEKYGTPSLLAELRMAGIPLEKQAEWCKIGNLGKPERDWMYASIASHVIVTHKPNVLLLHLVSVDAFEHATGRQTPEAYWAVNDSDNRVRDVVEAVERAGLRDKTTFFIVSDHGFITYSNVINPNVVLRKEGLLTVAGPKVVSKQAYALGQGGSSFVYVLDEANRAAIVAKLKTRLAAMEGVSAVLEPKDYAKWGHLTPVQDPRTPDLMIAAKDGYSFSDTAAGDLEISPSNPPKGTHGYLPSEPLMDGSFIASGAGIKKGVKLQRIRNVDVAPTMAAVLGLEMKDVDGRVLTEILKK